MAIEHSGAGWFLPDPWPTDETNVHRCVCNATATGKERENTNAYVLVGRLANSSPDAPTVQLGDADVDLSTRGSDLTSAVRQLDLGVGQNGPH